MYWAEKDFQPNALVAEHHSGELDAKTSTS
jgi:hypothetical protein